MRSKSVASLSYVQEKAQTMFDDVDVKQMQMDLITNAAHSSFGFKNILNPEYERRENYEENLRTLTYIHGELFKDDINEKKVLPYFGEPIFYLRHFGLEIFRKRFEKNFFKYISSCKIVR